MRRGRSFEKRQVQKGAAMKKALAGNRGMTVAEMVVNLAVVGVVISLMCYAVLTMARVARYYEVVAVRDSIQRDIVKAVLSRTALGYTKMNNPEFLACFRSGMPGNCFSGTTYGLNLYDQNGRLLTGPGFTGVNQVPAPVYYDRNGQACGFLPKATQQCPIGVTATFRAQGFPQDCSGCNAILPAPTPPPGQRHELVEINYEISVDYLLDIGYDVASSTGAMIWDLGDLGL
jgi:hypothetical protein